MYELLKTVRKMLVEDRALLEAFVPIGHILEHTDKSL